MAYYTNLINAWNNATQPPPGVTGTGLTSLTTANKLIAINGWTVTGSVPTSFSTTGSAVLNCINWAEFAALTATEQANVLALCNCPGPLVSGSAVLSKILPGMLVAYFPAAGPTITALTALAQAAVQQWWAANGYSSPINQSDLVAATYPGAPLS